MTPNELNSYYENNIEIAKDRKIEDYKVVLNKAIDQVLNNAKDAIHDCQHYLKIENTEINGQIINAVNIAQELRERGFLTKIYSDEYSDDCYLYFKNK